LVIGRTDGWRKVSCRYSTALVKVLALVVLDGYRKSGNRRDSFSSVFLAGREGLRIVRCEDGCCSGSGSSDLWSLEGIEDILCGKEAVGKYSKVSKYSRYVELMKVHGAYLAVMNNEEEISGGTDGGMEGWRDNVQSVMRYGVLAMYVDV
jgi:hypothetical protein